MRHDRRDELDQLLADGDEPLAGVLAALRASVDSAEVPEPSPALAALFSAGRPGPPRATGVPAAASSRASRRRRVMAAAGVALSAFAGTGVAGALPDRAQDAFDRVADVVGVERAPATVEAPALPERAPVETAPAGQDAPVGPELPSLPDPAPLDRPPADPVGPDGTPSDDRRPTSTPAHGGPTDAGAPATGHRPDDVPAPMVDPGPPPTVGDQADPEERSAEAEASHARVSVEPDPPDARP
ncbi:MAG TPA: hypothetical protein VFV42_00465 [Acidimicrobiales bacterium]|nr:hypothetical protein [Acidimicrobiales bacterium]